MKPPSPPERVPPEPQDPGAAWVPRWELLGLALCLTAVALMTWWALPDTPAGDPVVVAPRPPAVTQAGPTPSAVTVQPSSASLPVRVEAGQPAPAAPAARPPDAAGPRIARQRDPEGDLTPDLADHVNEGEVPTMAEVIARLHQAGVYTGLGAFSPPGTRPPLVGLVVPEDFVLPEGYVRHYQATDDGQRIEPILMFAPSVQLLDAQQRPLRMPQDRVVPPELAPAGLPLRQVVVPAPGGGSAGG
jgi:hypothetical protein